MTAADKKRFAKLKHLGCIVCLLHYNQRPPADIHHIETGMGRRKNHQKTIPLCKYHHVDGPFSVHGGKALFEKSFGTEAELQTKVDAMIFQGGRL